MAVFSQWCTIKIGLETEKSPSLQEEEQSLELAQEATNGTKGVVSLSI